MTKGEVKKFLSRAFYIRREEKRLEMKIAELRSLRERVTPSYSLAAGGGSGDRLTDLTAKIIELEQEQHDKMISYLVAYREIEKAIMVVEDTDIRLASIMRMKYLDDMSWEAVAADMGFSWRHIHRMKDRAIKIIQKSLIK